MNGPEFLQIWAAASAEVLQQTLGTKFEVQWEREEPPGPSPPEAEAGVWLEFTVAEPLALQQSFWISPSDAVYLGQSFVGEPADPLAELTPDHRDAVAELFRQIAGTASLAVKAQLGKECPIVFAGSRAPGWEPKLLARLRCSAEGCSPLALHLQADSDLSPPEALSPAAAAPAPAPPSAVSLPPLPPGLTPAPAPDTRNLDLLLDMQLEVAIRFGQREMVLRDILELNAGSVVDFEQHIEDPVELLLGPRVIGRGEVVVVDGNYGLRVTEITGAHARLNSLVK